MESILSYIFIDMIDLYEYFHFADIQLDMKKLKKKIKKFNMFNLFHKKVGDDLIRENERTHRDLSYL